MRRATFAHELRFRQSENMRRTTVVHELRSFDARYARGYSCHTRRCEIARGEKQPMSEKEFPPFGCLLFARVHPDVIKDTKFDPRAVPCAFIGTGELEGRKGMLGYTVDFSNKGRMGKIIHTVEYWVDPTFFHFRKAGGERVTSLS